MRDMENNLATTLIFNQCFGGIFKKFIAKSLLRDNRDFNKIFVIFF